MLYTISARIGLLGRSQHHQSLYSVLEGGSCYIAAANNGHQNEPQLGLNGFRIATHR